MPSEKILAQKKEKVTQLAEKLKSSGATIFVDYKGINVEDDTVLRRELRTAGVEYSVTKNSLLRFAAQEAGYDALCPIFENTTAAAFSTDDMIAPAKIFKQYIDAHRGTTVAFKGGLVDGDVIDADGVKALAALPSKDVLVAQVLGTLNAPITGFATVLNANIRGLAIVLDRIAEQKSA